MLGKTKSDNETCSTMKCKVHKLHIQNNCLEFPLKFDHVTAMTSQYLKIDYSTENKKKFEFLVPLTFEIRKVHKIGRNNSKSVDLKKWTNTTAVRFMKLILPDPTILLNSNEIEESIDCKFLIGESYCDFDID
jgi:hypothetical protein